MDLIGLIFNAKKIGEYMATGIDEEGYLSASVISSVSKTSFLPAQLGPSGGLERDNCENEYLNS